MSFLSCKPSVFVIGDEYEILLNASEKGILHVAVVCDYGKTNDIYVAQVELHAVGKWQRVTVEGSQFLSNSSERSKSMPADKVPEVLVLKSDQTFLVNNIILV